MCIRDRVYSGKERPPTSLANFFPPSSSRIDVLISPDADDDLLEAGIAAVAALRSRYPDTEEIQLGTLADGPKRAVATQRVVVLSVGRPGEVTTDVSTAPGTGVPVLTIAAAPTGATASSWPTTPRRRASAASSARGSPTSSSRWPTSAPARWRSRATA